MRRLALPLVVLFALALVSSAVAAPVFVFKGRGWGHGIGLSQWGAYGFALAGKDYRQILGHYYSGTSVSEGYGRTVTVLLASGRSSVTIGSDDVFYAGTTQLAASQRSVALAADGRIRVEGISTTFSSPLTFKPTAPAFVELFGSRYRGSLIVRNTGGALAVGNRLSLDSYVKGVVPNEMPAGWHLEALKAQSVAARSYAIALRGHCTFGGEVAFCATVSDQVYRGRESETARTNTAVDATAGEAVTYGASVAQTYFYSSSGGRTCAVSDCWGSSQALYPYLASVSDPYDGTPGNTNHRWGSTDPEVDCRGTARDCVYTRAALAARLGGLLPDRVRDMTVSRNASTYADDVTAIGSTTKTISAGDVRRYLGLRSPWFSVGVLSLAPGRSRIVYGETVTLKGIARFAGKPYLEAKREEGVWMRVADITPASDGRWSKRMLPRVTTSYRISSARATGVASVVRVDPGA